MVSGKTVLITGAGGGLGKAIADSFLSAGANVVICDINSERITSVNKEWTAASSSDSDDKFLTVQTDVTDETAIQALITATISKFGRLDIVINNAGIMDDFSPVGDCSREQWDRVLNVNLTAPFLVSKLAIAQFQKQTSSSPSSGGGLVINIGSTASYHGFKAGAAYTVSKAGIMALTKNTAGYYGDKEIYAIALLVGGMNTTNITDAISAGGMHVAGFQKIQGTASVASEEKMVAVESVAKYCVFLAGDDIAPSANGSCVVFNRNWPEA
ncbi:hypothetical protein QBC38DRAFT_472205 [Podospora fimiseda]|uniref:Uncharacterized protein n=1 Tax=Podospora fimiseda TaxID=252190 RepID=A0AAN7BTZ8_9PEZI|nr:hypothetical protein QBC38DRAFT_472205 [Podospora fimiseda]